MTIKLIYIGRGGALYHVPARDLTEADFAERAELWKENGIDEAVILATGLYEKPKADLSAKAQAEPKKITAAKDGK